MIFKVTCKEKREALKIFILRVGSLMPEESEGNNHTSKINFSIPSCTQIFIYQGFKNGFIFPTGGNKMHFMTR